MTASELIKLGRNRVNKTEVPPSEIKYAGFWIRFLAGIIDYSVLYGLVFAIGLILIIMVIVFEQIFAVEFGAKNIDYLGGSIGLLACVFYFAFLLSSSWQATLGMMVVGIKIVGYDYKTISFAKAFNWAISTILSNLTLFIGYFMIGFTKRKQGLHDLMASTYVIKG